MQDATEHKHVNWKVDHLLLFRMSSGIGVILKRPNNEKAFVLIVVGYPSNKCTVPKFAKNKKSLDKLLKESPDFREMILSPTVAKEDKKNVVNAIANQNNFSKILKNFLGILTIKNRLFILEQILSLIHI